MNQKIAIHIRLISGLLWLMLACTLAYAQKTERSMNMDTGEKYQGDDRDVVMQDLGVKSVENGNNSY